MKSKLYIPILLLIIPCPMFGQGPTPVRTAVVKKEKVADVRKVTGSLRAALISDIASLESGRIDDLRAKEGEQWGFQSRGRSEARRRMNSDQRSPMKLLKRSRGKWLSVNSRTSPEG